MRTNDLRLLAVCAFGLFAEPAAASQEGIDMRLEDAGFIMRPADTPEKLARLKHLPPRQFVRRKTAAGEYFLYADPDYCKCVLLGDQRAMQTYRDMVKPPSGAPTVAAGPSDRSLENTMIRDMDSDLDIPDGDILHFDGP